ncbi:hypothetical protein [Pontibacter sp. SGAir0037]|uniref:hypothetical protein n=1 Tax=Pontibacter sp. SGAir0037 TaxID=2571030 RepID=UPI0010CCF7F2|nr:hypothetical protein [Pontibacter sp. SGAir0037]QCR21143.1 hypothetical protein C1N53_01405 [Pontibacter sp. SGAir0037]
MKAHSPRLELFLHLLTALVLLLKGADKISHSHFISGSLLLLLAFMILALVFLEKRLHLSHIRVKQICFLVESLALSIISIVFFQEGRHYLPYVFGACALTYLIVAIVSFAKAKEAAH